ncbi:BQ2448_1737 [Microbotryum intermedium]|uniref:BQ2448_1737 protein n=1 Tax=Microbotryum intermedium TaxID=269621 RepID=A0A238FEA2_9BASI|nr:BQ2448_1737 [Microbotryum intermedium]
MERPTPRVNSVGLSQMGAGKVVRVIGKVISVRSSSKHYRRLSSVTADMAPSQRTQLDGDHAILELSDRGQVKVKLSRTANLADAYVEVIGKIDGEGSMTELSSCNMGSSIDMPLLEKVTELWAQYPNIFPSETE